MDLNKNLRLPPPVGHVLVEEHEMSGEKVRIVAKRYPNGRLAVEALEGDGSSYARLSVNVPALRIEPLEFIVANEIDDEDIAGLISTGAFGDSGKRVDYGFVRGARVLVVL